MKNFEMPKMNISIFSVENVVTTSGETPSVPTNVEAAKAAMGDSVTVTTVAAGASSWIDA